MVAIANFEPMITVVPIAGLCNRMRVVDSAIALAQATGKRLRVYWFANKDLQCDFKDLFRPIPGVEVIDGMGRASRLAFRFGRHHRLMARVGSMTGGRYYYWNENERLEKDAAMPKDLAGSRHIHIISYWRFLDRPDRYNGFHPIQELQARIDAITKDFDPWMVGVHIRRTDNEKAIAQSPTSLFIEAMRTRLAKEPRSRFYLATDDEGTKADLLDHFGNKVVTSQRPAVRTSAEGIQDALVDLYCLSRTSQLFGSFFSSFSRTAAELGNIPAIIVQQQPVS